MPREMQPMMAVATAEAMDSVEGSHFANGRRHFCYQIGLEKKTQTKDSVSPVQSALRTLSSGLLAALQLSQRLDSAAPVRG